MSAAFWSYLTQEPLLWLTMTLIAYWLGDRAFRSTGRQSWANPVMIAVILLSLLLWATGTDYQTYFNGAQFVHFMLGPATVALGMPLYENLHRVRKAALPLIPALMLFGLGKVPAVLATIIYAVPPLIRLTDLGIRQVDREVVEAATAFGANPRQILFGTELPLAMPTIMAGLNQTIMMALSMVVVASMIGARGLGESVLNGIQTLNVGLGLEAGLGIVILAVVLDRITQGFGRKRR